MKKIIIIGLAAAVNLLPVAYVNSKAEDKMPEKEYTLYYIKEDINMSVTINGKEAIAAETDEVVEDGITESGNMKIGQFLQSGENVVSIKIDTKYEDSLPVAEIMLFPTEEGTESSLVNYKWDRNTLPENKEFKFNL